MRYFKGFESVIVSRQFQMMKITIDQKVINFANFTNVRYFCRYRLPPHYARQGHILLKWSLKVLYLCFSSTFHKLPVNGNPSDDRIRHLVRYRNSVLYITRKP